MMVGATPAQDASDDYLFHFSDRGDIVLFEPRPVTVPAKRRPGQGWLNDALVWATDAAHAFLYLFPRDCPRIIAWPTDRTNASDRAAWFGMRDVRAIAFVEDAWMERIAASSVFRYALSPTSFEDIGDTGMWVSRTAVMPTAVTEITDLVGAQARHAIELRPVPRLTAVRSIWQTTLHVSGIRLRNAQDWTTTS